MKHSNAAHQIAENKITQLILLHYYVAADIYRDFLDIFVTLTRSQSGYLHLYDQKTDELSLQVWATGYNGQAGLLLGNHLPLKNTGAWTNCLRNKNTVIQNRCASGNEHPEFPAGYTKVENHMSVPIWADGQLVGILGVVDSAQDYSDTGAKKLENTVKNGWPYVEASLQKLTRSHKTKHDLFQHRDPLAILVNVLEIVSRSLEAKDEYTASHQSNVAFVANQIANKLALSQDQKLGLQMGALLHDIGKISVPAQLLCKPGKLSRQEYQLIQTHVETGAQMFMGLEAPWPVKEMIAQHHERADGSGYPLGLKGRDICLEARIIGVSDVFDAMSADRPYRQKPGITKAKQEIIGGRGKAYDPTVVDAFLACLNEDRSFCNRYK